MNPALDEDVVQRVNDLGITSWSGVAHRFTSKGRDPRSGTGARLNGGRWNPRGAFAAIYLAQPLRACLAELDRQSRITNLPVAARIAQGIELHTLAVVDVPMLDLRADEALSQVGLTTADVRDDDQTACQAVGHAAYFLEYGGVLAPSATGIGLVATVFESRLRPGRLNVQDSHLLTETEYRHAMPT